MNVVLIGFRCAGKSSVGRDLAERLGREFVDCDEYIERKTHLSIREIFDVAGESHFRRLESEAIERLAKLRDKVIATGGGAALKYKNMQALRRNGILVYLEVAPDTAYRRMQRDPLSRSRRPALTPKDSFTEISEQIAFRRPYYLKSAHHTIHTDGKSLEEVVEQILRHLKRRGIDNRGDRDGVIA